MKTRRLLVVTHYFPGHGSGVEVVAGNLARRLARRGWDVTWAASNVGPPGDTAGIRIVPMPAWNFSEDKLGVPWPVWPPKALADLAKLVRSADVVHLHDCLYMGNAAAAFYCRRYRKPYVVTQHVGMVPYRSRVLRSIQWLAYRTLGRAVLSHAAVVIFIAPKVRAEFLRFVKFKRETHFIPNGVDTSTFKPMPRQIDSVPQLLFVGRFVEKKGLAVLRDVAKAMPDLGFTFVGRGPIDPASWGLPNVTVLGPRGTAELPAIYSAADLLVLPSVGEGFPLVVQESMACGTPALISTDTADGVPGVHDWAIVTDPTPAAIIPAIRKGLASNLESRRQHVAELAHREWDWNVSTDRYARLIEQLASPIE